MLRKLREKFRFCWIGNFVVAGPHCAGGTDTGFAELLDRNTATSYASETYHLIFLEFSTTSPRILSSRDSVSLPRKGICLRWSLVKMWTGITYVWDQWRNIVTQYRAFRYCGRRVVSWVPDRISDSPEGLRSLVLVLMLRHRLKVELNFIQRK